MSIRETICAYTSLFYQNTIHIISNMTNWSERQTIMITTILCCYLLGIILLIIIHRSTTKKQRKIEKTLIAAYDMILYQANKAQHENPLIQGESCIQTINQSAHKNYDANAAAIQNQIHTREQKLGTTIIPPQQWSLITKQSKTKHRYLQRSHLIGRLLTILTVGIYKLVG